MIAEVPTVKLASNSRANSALLLRIAYNIQYNRAVYSYLGIGSISDCNWLPVEEDLPEPLPICGIGFKRACPKRWARRENHRCA